MSVTYKSDHVSEALDWLIEKFKGLESWENWLTPFLNQIQDLEDVFYAIEQARHPDNATGAQLDGCGAIVGEPRYGRGDDDYRVGIKVRIAINRSRGTPEDVINILSILCEYKSIEYQGSYPAGYLMWIMEALDPADDPSTWVDYVEDATVAGVRVMIGSFVEPAFTWDVGYSDGDGTWGTGAWGTSGWGGVIIGEDDRVWDRGLWGTIFG